MSPGGWELTKKWAGMVGRPWKLEKKNTRKNTAGTGGEPAVGGWARSRLKSLEETQSHREKTKRNGSIP